MSMRVATFANNDQMLSASLRAQAEMSKLQLQEASGQVSTSYAGYGNATRKLVNLDVSLQQSKTYSTAATEASSRTTVMYDTMSSVTDLLTSFRSQLTAVTSADGTTDTSIAELKAAASSALDDLKSALNTQYEGRYVFSGSDTTTAPVDLTSYAPTLDAADTSYYQGNSDVAAVRVSSDRTVSYGVTVDSSAFEQAFRVLSSIANSDGTPDADTLSTASDLITSALDGTIAIQSKLSLTASSLDSASNEQQDYQDFLTTQISDVRDVDVTAISVKLTSYETQLQASYSALAKVQSLSLMDYLK
ncbi:MAG: flagellin [Devosia sp.]|nr:flagellin [Devosia sp.]